MTGKRKGASDGRAAAGSPNKAVQLSKLKENMSASPVPKKQLSTAEGEKIVMSRKKDEEEEQKKTMMGKCPHCSYEFLKRALGGHISYCMHRTPEEREAFEKKRQKQLKEAEGSVLVVDVETLDTVAHYRAFGRGKGGKGGGVVPVEQQQAVQKLLFCPAGTWLVYVLWFRLKL